MSKDFYPRPMLFFLLLNSVHDSVHHDVGIHTSLRGKEFHVNSKWTLSVFEHDQRDVTDGMRTPWTLPVNVASKNCVGLSSTCLEVPAASCFFDDHILSV